MMLLTVTILAISLLGLSWPFAIYPLILRRMSQRPMSHGSHGTSAASLLFCAFNEADAMPAKTANIAALQARHSHLEALAFDDGSSDGTVAIVEASVADVKLVVGGGRSGKAHGMKRLAAMATGDILIFTDANVMLAEDAVEKLLGYYADPNVGGVLGSLHYAGAEGSATASVGSFYWRLEESLKDLESDTGNVMGADGSIFSIRRELYPDFPDDVLDDLTVSMAVVFAGKRLIKARDVIAHEMLVSKRGEEYRRKVRIASRAWRTHQYLRPQLRRMSRLDRFKYNSRKVVRWFGAIFIVTGTLSALGLAWIWSPMLALALLSMGLAFLALGYALKRGPVAAVFDILIAYFATLQGIFRAMRGQNQTVWAPAKSR